MLFRVGDEQFRKERETAKKTWEKRETAQKIKKEERNG